MPVPPRVHRRRDWAQPSKLLASDAVGTEHSCDELLAGGDRVVEGHPTHARNQLIPNVGSFWNDKIGSVSGST